MGKVDELYKTKKIFDELFGCFEIVIKTKDYYYDGRDKIHESYYVEVKSSVNIVTEEITAEATSVRGEIHETITRFFSPSIPPQLVKQSSEILLLKEDASEILLSDDWNTEYRDILLEAVGYTITSLIVKDDNSGMTSYPIKAKEIYVSEFNN